MNERTKQLWEESQQWNRSDDGRGGLKILESVEKFAALVAAEEREACAKMCEAQVAVYLKDGERWLKGKKGKPDTRLKDLAPHLEEAWEAEQLLKNESGVEWITQAHKCAAAIRARGNE